MIRTQIQLTEAQVNALRLLAGKEGVSMAELIRSSVDRFMQATGQEADPELMARAREAAGKYGSGIPDLAENHDWYYAGDEIR